MTPQNLRAVLGPTNTGKTFLAIERMLGHATGMIGFPLRLLARENYDRIVKVRGKAQVALITGEERIIPANPRYFLCTVEAMPLDRAVDFLGVDEIQLCADPERGHVFTDRLLYARGREETMFMGADTAGPIIRKLVPGVQFEQRERMSKLAYTGPKKLTRLPPRSAVIAFSAANVYALAEVLRRRRGGTAVVLGALSPRTRNAQVAMYEAGEVDYLVATDAIGMGLNMAIDHVAFTALAKYDGQRRRYLAPAEVAQIAGRAGRHMADGTFGTTADLGPMDREMVESLEEHRFDNIKRLYWRNTDLDFATPKALRKSLGVAPPSRLLTRVRTADDVTALEAMLGDEEVMARVGGAATVKLLWDVCQVPDFRKDLAESHARLVKRLYLFLTADAGVIPEPWVANAIKRLDRIDGDIDTLVGRIAATRTWTYISHRGNWLEDSDGWQERARALEDKLSDALHERLTQRFVDRRAAALVGKLARGGPLLGAVTKSDDVVVEGEAIGQMVGFQFVPEPEHADDKAVMATANNVVRESIGHRVNRCVGEPNKAFKLDPDGGIRWDGAVIARLARGPKPHRPEVTLVDPDLLDRTAREQVRGRLARWLDERLGRALEPLRILEEADLGGAARGLAFQVVEGLGGAPTAAARAQVAALKAADRKALGALGVRLGVEAIYMPAMLKRRPLATRGMLAVLGHDNVELGDDFGGPVMMTRGIAPEVLLAAGYHPAQTVAVRGDVLERLLAHVRQRCRKGETVLRIKDAASAGLGLDGLAEVLRQFGFGVAPGDGSAEGGLVVRSGSPASRAGRARRGRKERPGANPDSPFAKLAELRNGAPAKMMNGAVPNGAVPNGAIPNGPIRGHEAKDQKVNGKEPAVKGVFVEGSQRLDKWLWFARFARTRTLASALCKAGKVRVNRVSTSKPGAMIKSGDVLTFPLGRGIKVVRVLAPGERRGPAKQAQLLYEDMTPPEAPRSQKPERARVAPRTPGSGRPTKRDRRATERLRGGPGDTA